MEVPIAETFYIREEPTAECSQRWVVRTPAGEILCEGAYSIGMMLVQQWMLLAAHMLIEHPDEVRRVLPSVRLLRTCPADKKRSKALSTLPAAIQAWSDEQRV